jgi:hypothetical protein
LFPDGWDSVYGALATQCRRQLLGYLYQADGQASVDEVVTALSTDDRASSALNEDTLRVHLHHVHLPRLETAGLVEWNREEATVALTDWADQDFLFGPLPNGLVGTPLADGTTSLESTDRYRPAEGTGD